VNTINEGKMNQSIGRLDLSLGESMKKSTEKNVGSSVGIITKKINTDG